MRAINFGAGPSMLPMAVLESIKEELLDFRGTGISMLEHGHRGKVFGEVFQRTNSLLRDLWSVPQSHSIFWMTGGGSAQFALLPMNFLHGGVADYVDTGTWSTKAFEGATYYGKPRWAASGKVGDVYARAPMELAVGGESRYVHLTSNATLRGIQYRAFPDVGSIPLVADMSSDILSRRVDVAKFKLIYAGAQKNLGIPGVTLVVADRDFLKTGDLSLHPTLRYQFISDSDSLHNTPPTFAIYVVGKMLEWIASEGGVPEMERRSAIKSGAIYEVIDRHSTLYGCPVEKDSRSQMNVVFFLPDDNTLERFLAGAEERNFRNLRGHRSTGGVRASLYNAVTLENAAALAEYMEEFALHL